MCKKMLILGSDYGTLQVVKEAHKSGIYVIVTDTMQDSPTKQEADESWMISTTDIDKLEIKCKESNVDAIMFGASDFNINNARQLCKKLKLPIYCENDYAWHVARDKGEFKQLCKEVGAPVANDYKITDNLTEEELNNVKYPVVVKPVDKSGNRGMSYCKNKAELIIGYKKAREISGNKIIVERQLHGNEYNVHYVLANGEARLLYFSSTHHEPGQLANLYSFKNTTSNYLKQYIDEVDKKAIKVIHKAGCREGIVWFDCIRDEDGHFYLLEMGYRFGGVMTYRPYEQVCGFNTIKWMIECSLGIKHTVDDLPELLFDDYQGCAASYHLFALEGGKVNKIYGISQILKIPDVYVDMPKRDGAVIRKYACMGLIGIYGKNIEDLCEKLRKINSLLKVENENQKNMIIYFDDYNSLKKEYYKGKSSFN